MPRTKTFKLRLGLVAPLALIIAVRAPDAFAQAPAATPTPAPPAAATPAPVEPTAAPPAAPAAEAAKELPSATDLATLRAELDETKKALEEVKSQQSDAETAATPAEDSSSSGDALKIYGFMDMGVSRTWVNKSSVLSTIFQGANNTTFVVGNVNFYFDAQPIKHFRGLAEVRFTNQPLGEIVNYGGLAGTFQRKDSFSYDSGGTALNAPIWSGGVILERAWIEWNELQALKFRVGNFFTPFGIWNEDHGTPTLISLALPQFIIQRQMPIRQTGMMVYGNAFAGDWELGYAATLSNGRQEISNYNFNNSIGLGGRVYARRDTGSVNTTFGLSYFTGTTRDKETDVVIDPSAANGIGFADKTKFEYTEHVAGADASIDIGPTRIRSEAVIRRQVYKPGQRPPGSALFSPGSFAPDLWQETVYLLVAHQLPWAGLEPYLYAEYMENPTIISDASLGLSLGLNIHFNSSVQWKTQATRSMFFNALYHSPYDVSANNVSQLYSRLVMAF